MREEEHQESSTQCSGRRRRRRKGLYFTSKRDRERERERASSMKKKSQEIVDDYVVDLAETERNKEICEMDEEVDIHVDAVSNIVEEPHIGDAEGEESDNNRIVEEDQNNIDGDQKADEGGGNLQIVSTHVTHFF